MDYKTINTQPTLLVQFDCNRKHRIKANHRLIPATISTTNNCGININMNNCNGRASYSTSYDPTPMRQPGTKSKGKYIYNFIIIIMCVVFTDTQICLYI